jgi:hypothetical protein
VPSELTDTDGADGQDSASATGAPEATAPQEDS